MLRTCYSIINRSPEHLLVEIILVDDGSDWEYLKEKLDAYVAEYLPKVKIIRLPHRMGLIKARAEGALIARADILLFLDAHCEPNVNWLPPLLGKRSILLICFATFFFFCTHNFLVEMV